ncbi:MAG TPA: FHA domain-containing protein [Usitatibacter sp.]|nr:FHA domain-containing protein [Usitatibacter sp.]
MGEVMWIEVLSRHGEVGSRQRIEGDVATVGRAFDNDVVLDDPHVAPHHLRISRGEDGELAAEDLGTLNGLFHEHGATRTPRVSLAKEPGIRIGRTVLRVHDSRHPVPPERLLTPPRAHAKWAVGLGVAVVGTLAILEWLNLTTEPNVTVILRPMIGFVTGLALWTGAWALVSRIFLGQARFALQLRIALTACAVLVAWDQLTESLSFSFAWRALSDYAGLGFWALLAAACWAHLRVIGPRRMRVAMGLVVALTAAGAALQYLARSESQKLVGTRASLGDLRPPEFRLAPLASADDFFKNAAFTKAKVDQLRAKEPTASGLFGDDVSD